MKLIRTLIEACGEGIVYDLVCHGLTGLLAWHLLSGTPAAIVAMVAHHMDAPATATAQEVE